MNKSHQFEDNDVFIAIGGNQGNVIKTFQTVINNLHGGQLQITAISHLYKTKAMYNTDQPDFINGVFRTKTDLSPHDLLSRLKEEEARAGRKIMDTQYQYQPRPLDLDIIYYGSKTIDTPDLKIPHPLRLERPFVLKPLLDLVNRQELSHFDKLAKNYINLKNYDDLMPVNLSLRLPCDNPAQ